MLWSRRAVLFGALALGACGLRPAGQTATQLHGAVRVQNPTDKDAFDMVRQIERRFGPPQTVRYALQIDVLTVTEGVAISIDDDTTRQQVVGEATYILTETTTDDIVSTGTVRSFTGFSTTGSTVATRTAEIDVRKRLMVILADQIVTKILADVGS